jgi:hypothetical protein
MSVSSPPLKYQFHPDICLSVVVVEGVGMWATPVLMEGFAGDGGVAHISMP